MGIVVHACEIVGYYDGVYGDPVDFIKDRDKLKINKDTVIPVDTHKLRSTPNNKT